MTFSFFAILMILIVVLVAFIHSLQGFFSATISAILAIFSAVVALSYHEIIVEKFVGGALPESGNAIALIMLFAGIYFILRVIFDQVIPGNIRLPAAADKVGGALMGAVAGVFGAGIMAVAAQEMSFFPAILGYSRYAVADHEVRLPTANRTQDMTVKDQMTSPSFEESESAGEKQKLLLPVDDILVNMTSRLSSAGALSAGNPLSVVHPDWLTEAFGQRLGAEPGAKRVLNGLPSAKTPEAKLDNLYLIGESDPGTHLTDLQWIDGEYSEVRGTAKVKVATVNVDGHPSPNYAVKPNHYLIVARVRFPLSAGDKLGGGIVRIGTGMVRLVAPGVSTATGEPLDHVDYYPIGTLQYRGPAGANNSNNKSHPLLNRPVLMLQNPDDYLLIRKDDDQSDTNKGGSDMDAGADFVFSVARGALETRKVQTKEGVTLDQMQMKDGTFIEIKRLVREDLSGHALLPEPLLQVDKDSIAIIRRDKLLLDAFKNKDKGLFADPSSPTNDAAAPPAAATPTPAPAPPAGGPESAFPLDVTDAPKLSAKFYSNVASDRDSGDLTLTWPDGAKGTMSVDSKQIRAVSIDGATAADMHGTAKLQFINLASPANMSLVQVSGSPRTDAAGRAWTWKDQFNDLALVDGTGARIGPPIGAWVQYSDSTTKVSARFNVEGGAKMDDIKPAGEVMKVWFVFAVPHGTKIAKVVAGQATVSAQALDVP